MIAMPVSACACVLASVSIASVFYAIRYLCDAAWRCVGVYACGRILVNRRPHN